MSENLTKTVTNSTNLTLNSLLTLSRSQQQLEIAKKYYFWHKKPFYNTKVAWRCGWVPDGKCVISFALNTLCTVGNMWADLFRFVTKKSIWMLINFVCGADFFTFSLIHMQIISKTFKGFWCFYIGEGFLLMILMYFTGNKLLSNSFFLNDEFFTKIILISIIALFKTKIVYKWA